MAPRFIGPYYVKKETTPDTYPLEEFQDMRIHEIQNISLCWVNNKRANVSYSTALHTESYNVFTLEFQSNDYLFVE